MYNKDYRDYLEVLRAREARPTFAHVASLVAAAPTRRTIPFFAKFLGALVIGGIIAAGVWTLNKSHITVMPQQSRRDAIKIAGDPSSSPAQSFSSPQRDQALKSRKGQKEIAGDVSPRNPDKGSFSSPEGTKEIAAMHTSDSTGPKAPVLHSVVNERVASVSPPVRDTHPVAPIAIPNSENENENYFFATLGGAIAQQFSSNAPLRNLSFTDAFLGAGYNLARNSSVRILGGEEVFALSSATQSISYHDTTFVHNGQSYPNIIGEVQTLPGAAITRIYWLGASYRYTLGTGGGVRPFGEVMAGGSSQGLLSHQSLGAEWDAAYHVDLDLLLQASELLPQNSSWLTKAGISAAISYRW